jgi:hypothetical protein
MIDIRWLYRISSSHSLPGRVNGQVVRTRCQGASTLQRLTKSFMHEEKPMKDAG